MKIETGRSLVFSDVDRIFASGFFNDVKIGLSWSFMGEVYNSESIYYQDSNDVGRLFVNYKNTQCKIGTFVLDEDTLATDFSLVFAINRNGKKIK